MSLQGKVAWITGGGSGIGLAGAVELAKAGAKVVISGRSAATLKEAAKKCDAETIALDVSSKEEVQKAVRELVKRHGAIDILVASAGINMPQRNFRNISLDGWDQIVAVNLSGMFYCVHSVLPAMREKKDGLIINVSSWAGRHPSTLTGPGYNATKHAVIALTESINMEECANGIRATALLPGEAATPILEKRPVPPTPEVRAKMLQPEDLGRAIGFIASLPARACVNELTLTPTWNRFYLGGFEVPKT
jgi:NADP-dependent 3-hydroxy acid dehydrogenase YdfG